jgi:serralysin
MPSRLVSRQVLRAASALTLAIGTGLVAPLVLAGTAGAATAPATAVGNGQSIAYTAAAGQTNKATITASKNSDLSEITYVIDDVVTIKAGNSCTYPTSSDHTKVSCTVATLDSQDPYSTLTVALGDGNDVLTYKNNTDQAYYFAQIDGGTGKDTLTSTGDVDGSYVSGGPGDDTLTVGAYAVTWGGDGNDTIHAAAGTIAQGGNGNDTIYSTGDGSAVAGGAGNDVIHAGADGQSLSGDDGNDTIYGGAGSDVLYGGKGNDVLYGQGGNDKLYGNSGNDKLYGGPGRDTLSGGPGTDIVHQD